MPAAEFEEIQKHNGADTAKARQAIACRIDIAYGPDEMQKLDVYYPGMQAARDGSVGARPPSRSSTARTTRDIAPGDARAADPASPRAGYSEKGGFPVLVDIHGGGWRAGSKNGRGFPAETFVPKGFVWVTVDYGLAPKHKIAAIVDHVRSAFAWTYQNVKDYGGDPERIYVCGHSAGGHLTGMLLVDGWHAKYGVLTDAIKGAVASSGVFDMEALVHAPRGYNDELGMTLADARAHSPYYHLPKRACPIIVTYGGNETREFVRQSRAFARAWREAGLSVTEIECKGDHHFSIARTFVDPRSELHKAAMKMIGL